MKLKAQPLLFESMYELWLKKPVMAAEAWVRGTRKPREVIRENETPPEDLSLPALEKRGMIEVAPPLKVQSAEDLKKIPADVDFFIIGETGDLFVPDEILEKLSSFGKPIMAEWDAWGYSWFGRLSKFRLEKFFEQKYFYTAGAEDLKASLGAVRAWKKLTSLRPLYVGEFPSHSVVTSNKCFDFDYLRKKFGIEISFISNEEYIKTVENISEAEAGKLAGEWREKYEILDGRENNLTLYARIYLGIHKLLQEYKANALTMDCAWLPDVEYVPCFTFSQLIEEEIMAACEGDLPALLMGAALMGASEEPVLMGNLDANATHKDLENNIITINHDLVPLSLGHPTCRPKLRDFHATGKGLTPYVELKNNELVTIAGMHWDLDKMLVTKGLIRWTEDTTHCRITIGIEVKKAKQLHKLSFGHHQVMTYGDHTQALQGLAQLLGLQYLEINQEWTHGK
ncbi:MAG: L-arabinose isomerase family protein [Candidatus Saccharicenans sp.]